MNELIDQGVAKGLISFDAEQKNINYKVQNKRLRFNDPEEKVRAKAYLSLVLEYDYSPEQIDIEVAVEHRVPNIFSDIVVYADKSLKKPLILVECKREEASQGELDQGIEQGFGYLMGLNQGKGLPHENFILLHNGSIGDAKSDVGFNLNGIKQLRVEDTDTLREEVRQQVAIYYGLTVA